MRACLALLFIGLAFNACKKEPEDPGFEFIVDDEAANMITCRSYADGDDRVSWSIAISDHVINCLEGREVVLCLPSEGELRVEQRVEHNSGGISKGSQTLNVPHAYNHYTYSYQWWDNGMQDQNSYYTSELLESAKCEVSYPTPDTMRLEFYDLVNDRLEVDRNLRHVIILPTDVAPGEYFLAHTETVFVLRAEGDWRYPFTILRNDDERVSGTFSDEFHNDPIFGWLITGSFHVRK